MIDIDIADRILKVFHSCSKQEQSVLRQILEELADTGESRTYNEIWLSDYKEIPVDINTFIEDDYYLGKTNRQGRAVYPYWRKVLSEIFDAGNKYEECFFTGATRIGKSSTAITGTAYMLYRLMCLRDPQEYFGKKDVSKFSILFFNITKDLASGVAFREFNDTLRASPWFNEHGTFSKSERNFYYIPEGGKVVIDFGSDAAHGLGQQVFVGFMDEMNFSRAGVKDVNKAKAHMKDLYNTISARVKGTFRMNGEVYGKIFAVSSKRSDSDFMEAYMEDQQRAGAGEHMYISDAPQWDVLPPSMFSPEKFYIAVGDRHKKGFVVPDNQTFPEALEELRQQGYTLMTPPVDMRPEFLADFDIALRDLAGISVPGALSFITQAQINACIGTRRNPFYSDIIQVGTHDNYSIEEFFHLKEIDKKYFSMPHYLHLDLSLNDDKTGITDVCISGRKDIKDMDGKVLSLPTFTHIFSISIEAPRGSNIPYDKITTFILWLRNNKFNIQGISRDQFQSEYMAQILEAKGFGKVPKISLDRTPDGYKALRSVLSEQRIDLLRIELLEQELIHLQRDSISGKVDHPVGGCFTGDTKIRLVDGRSLTIEELMIEQQYRDNWVYTVNLKDQTIEPKRIKRVFQTKLTSELVKVTFDNGESVTCTLDHRFMMRDGSYVEAALLKSGDSMMPIYTKLSNKGLGGYRLFYDPFENCWKYEHRQFCKNAIHKKGYVVHHCNYNKEDNCPSNLKCMTTSDHRRIHNNCTQDYRKTSQSLKQWYCDISGTEREAERSESCRSGTVKALQASGRYKNLAKRRQDRIAAIEAKYGVVWDELSDSDKDRYGVKYTRYNDPSIQERIIASVKARHAAGLYENARKVLADRVWYTNGSENVYIKKDEDPPEGFHRGRTIPKRADQRIQPTGSIRNHKVVSVEFVHRPCRVYDLTIEDNPNFALDAGVFVHNSKDVSDTLAGSVWNAILNNPGVPVGGSTIASAISAVNKPRTSLKKGNVIPAMPGLNYNRRR